MNSHYVLVKIVTNDSISLLKTLYDLNIFIDEITYGKKEIFIKIEYKDYTKIKKFFKCNIVKHYSVYGLKRNALASKIYIFSYVLMILLVACLSNIILEVRVIHTNPEVREKVERELRDYDLKRYTLKRDYDYLTKVKEEITLNNPDLIEWMEIENIGMKYIVRVEQRIITSKEEDTSFCNLIAKKDGLVTRFHITKGDLAVTNNMYVKKGDILVKGAIQFNEETKNNVCASGNVYANTWYTMNIKINKEYVEKKRTGKKRWNVRVKTKDKDYLIFRSRLERYEVDSKKVLSVFRNTLYLETDYEVEEITKEYEETEVDALVEQEIEKKIKDLLKEDYEIKEKKVLKKEVNDSMIDIEVFLVVEENIALEEKYQVTE